MSKEIEIKIHQNSILLGVLMTVSLIAFIGCGIHFLLSFYQSSLSLIMLILYLASGALFGFFIYLDQRPTVVWSDGEQLCRKHFFREHRIYLTEITDVICEPYSVSSRYGTYQRIRLTLRTQDKDIVLNDTVNAGDLIEEKLGNKKVSLPLMQLNSYLREHCFKQ